MGRAGDMEPEEELEVGAWRSAGAGRPARKVVNFVQSRCGGGPTVGASMQRSSSSPGRRRRRAAELHLARQSNWSEKERDKRIEERERIGEPITVWHLHHQNHLAKPSNDQI